MNRWKRRMGLIALVVSACSVAWAAPVAVEQPRNMLLQENLVPEIRQTQPEVTKELVLGVNEAVSLALQQNRDIQIAKYRYEEAKESVAEVAAAKNPSIQYQFQGAKQKARTNYVTVPNPMNPTGAPVQVPVVVDRGYRNQLSLTWPIWTGGQVENGIRAARAGRDVAELDWYKTEAQTKVDAIKAYYQLVEAMHLREIADTSVANLTGHVENVQAHYRAGVVAKLDVLASEVALANAKENQIKAESGVILAEASINHLLGLPSDTKVVPAAKEMPNQAIDVTEAQVLSYAMQERWELAQAKLGVEAAKANLGMAKSGNMPTIALSAGINWQDVQFPGDKNEDWTVGGGVSWKLFDGGATAAKIAKQKANLEAAEVQMSQAESAVRLDVIQAYRQVQSAQERIRATEKSMDQAAEAFHIAQVRYRAGVGINLDVLDAQLQLNQARTNYIQALYDYNIGLADLERAMGVPAVLHMTEEEVAQWQKKPLTAADLLGRK